jgi:hypothetical protein
MNQILRFGRLLVQVLSTGHLQLTRISGQKRGQKVEKTSNSQNRARALRHNNYGNKKSSSIVYNTIRKFANDSI